MRLVSRVVLVIVLVAGLPLVARAQIYEAVGTRAQGMGGAFVAVADDATASWWNPAGLATGAYFNAVIERGRTTQPADPADAPASASSRATTSGFAVAFPALGLSYYRVRVSEITPAKAAVVDGREDPGSPRLGRSLRYSQFGATVGQSIGEYFVLGSTLKLLRAGQVSSVPLAADGSLDTVDDLSPDVRTKLGLDLGLMASFHVMRVGVSVRNVHAVNVGSDAEPLRLERSARAGLVLLGGKHALLDAISVSADADLTKSNTIFGDVRHVATGAEAWLFNRHVGLRGGLNVNSIGDLRPVGSVGASVAPVSGFFIDAAWSDGRDASLRGWTTSIRLTF